MKEKKQNENILLGNLLNLQNSSVENLNQLKFQLQTDLDLHILTVKQQIDIVNQLIKNKQKKQ
ncbi:hypothetical protein B5M19_02485 [Mesomycoplasma hyopneumoniae]|uniref:Uncharacterized protein n=3 Tax=Mesomycoplasma hyopneumoniae TaxID=2099 RepID=A0A223M8Y6_MESHO|nr:MULTISPECIES: hypothetical protein [Mesomycoplasma]ADQ90441.1 Predicted protein [Mesomycoplasma hyopneumoniae 168]AGM22009.1 hypothetical protein MHP168L_229 [Mesomycoplasma hyopneumoniae 168-L]ASU13927.1 hypothetical protein CIB43_00010 [Mesomycoplasma hyopneumoniae]MCI8283358.1 hypothetical protein [Mesomycoplasma hyopneumoniae]MCI8298290.1 hypothetical protein [Mesomycoplasma hyopneumoniae]